MALATDDGSDLLPLILGWINTGRVVCAGVEEDDTTTWRIFDCLGHSIEIKTLCLGGKVWVVFDRELDV